MKKLTFFPMNRTESGNLVLQSIDDSTLNGTKLVFVDALRAEHFGIASQVKQTWVECRAAKTMPYAEFCAKERIAIEGVDLMPFIDGDTNEPWITKVEADGSGGEQWYGIVRVD